MIDVAPVEEALRTLYRACTPEEQISLRAVAPTVDALASARPGEIRDCVRSIDARLRGLDGQGRAVLAARVAVLALLLDEIDRAPRRPVGNRGPRKVARALSVGADRLREVYETHFSATRALQREFRERIGCSKAAHGAWRRGEGLPHATFRMRIKTQFGIAFEWWDQPVSALDVSDHEQSPADRHCA